MKISNLPRLQSIDLEASLPVSVVGQTMRVSLRQLVDVLASSLALFGGIEPEEVMILEGATTSDGEVVYLARQHRFVFRVATADGYAYYDQFEHLDRYMVGSVPLYTCLFVDTSTGLLYRYDVEQGWRPVGLTEHQVKQLRLNTPVEIESEAKMEQLISAGLCEEGQLYYITEE